MGERACGQAGPRLPQGPSGPASHSRVTCQVTGVQVGPGHVALPGYVRSCRHFPMHFTVLQTMSRNKSKGNR